MDIRYQFARVAVPTVFAASGDLAATLIIPDPKAPAAIVNTSPTVYPLPGVVISTLVTAISDVMIVALTPLPLMGEDVVVVVGDDVAEVVVVVVAVVVVMGDDVDVVVVVVAPLLPNRDTL